jgi:hypothetical protein
MAVLFACDVVGRFLPLDLVAFRTFEPALNPQAGHGTAGFKPNYTTRMHNAYGDLAAMSNSRRLRQYHNEEFHSDQFGFRNGYDIHAEHYGGIVLGDSFAVSSGVPEDQTLSGVLSQLSGARYYNAGWSRHLLPAEVRYLAANLKIDSGVVVCELLERVIKIGSPPLDDALTGLYSTPAAAESAAGASAFLPWLTEVQRRVSPDAVSPLQILGGKIVKRLQNGTLQPNPYWPLAIHKRLANKDDMLFVTQDADDYSNSGPIISSWVTYLEWFNQRLQARNLKLVVLLVPNKLTVYGPLAKPPSEMEGSVHFLQTIEQDLRERGIPVVNVTSDLRAAASQDLAKHQYVYWRDDTHWNAAGIAIAANAVWRTIQTLDNGQHSTTPVQAADPSASTKH